MYINVYIIYMSLVQTLVEIHNTKAVPDTIYVMYLVNTKHLLGTHKVLTKFQMLNPELQSRY